MDIVTKSTVKYLEDNLCLSKFKMTPHTHMLYIICYVLYICHICVLYIVYIYNICFATGASIYGCWFFL